MKKIDSKIFYLKAFLSKNKFNRQEIAKHLYITERHLSRLIKQWEKEGLILYKPGNGRGHPSSLEFIVDIEGMLIDSFLLNIESQSFDDLDEIMKLPISEATKTVLTNELMRYLFSTTKMSKSEVEDDKFIDYYRDLPVSLFLSEDRNYATLTLKLNVLSRLYEVNDEGELEHQIVLHDEWVENTLIIYLRKDIKYYDGTIMAAQAVVDSLRQIFYIGRFRYLRQYIVSIDVLDTFKFTIEFTTRLEIIRYLLGTLSSGIYKIVDGKLLTSGPYYIESMDQQNIVLKSNPYYFGQHGDVHHVELTSDIEKYSEYLKKNEMRSTSTTDNSVIEYIIANPRSKFLKNYERLYVMHLISEFMRRHNFHDNATHLSNHFDNFVYKYDDKPIQIKGMLTITYHESVLQAQQLVYFLQQHNVAAAAVPSTSKSPEGDLYWGVTLQEQLWFAKMLTTESFGSWFIDQEESKNLIKSYKDNHMKMWVKSESIYENWLLEHAYFIPIKHVKRQLNLPGHLLNLSSNALSILDYNKFFKK